MHFICRLLFQLLTWNDDSVLPAVSYVALWRVLVVPPQIFLLAVPDSADNIRGALGLLITLTVVAPFFYWVVNVVATQKLASTRCDTGIVTLSRFS